MVCRFLVPELLRRSIDINSVCFQQDGARPHTTRATLNMLGTVFPEHVSQNGNLQWPARSPDLTACNYFLWGFLKSKVFVTMPRNVSELKHRISEEIRAIQPDIIQKVMGNLIVRLKDCVRTGGRHLSDILKK